MSNRRVEQIVQNVWYVGQGSFSDAFSNLRSGWWARVIDLNDRPNAIDRGWAVTLYNKNKVMKRLVFEDGGFLAMLACAHAWLDEAEAKENPGAQVSGASDTTVVL